MTTFIIFSVFFLSNCSGSNAQTNNNTTDTIKQDNSYLQTGWYYIIDNNNFKRQLDKSSDFYFIDPEPIVTVKNFTKLEIYTSNFGDIELSIQLDKIGVKNWSNATERATGNYLAFILDNRLLHIAYVNSQIMSGITVLNRSDYSKEELEKIKASIESEK